LLAAAAVTGTVRDRSNFRSLYDVRESTSFEPLCVKIGWGGSDPRRTPKKSKKVTETPMHRKDMALSPLTQGLNDRSACDF